MTNVLVDNLILVLGCKKRLLNNPKKINFYLEGKYFSWQNVF